MAEITKTETLRKEGTLNPRPDDVVDPGFKENEFFDPRDIVQVKYEMLRRVRAEQIPVTQAAADFGFSRPAFYDAQANFDQGGVAALVPKKRGPRGPRKLRPEVLEFLRGRIEPNQPLRASRLVRELEETFGVRVHPRTIERALGAGKKKR